MIKSNMTYHARYDRADRITAIIDTIGIGEIMFIVPKNEYSEICLTTTGVVIVRTITERRIITVYVASLQLARALYATKFNMKKLPQTLFNVIRQNQKYADLINNGLII